MVVTSVAASPTSAICLLAFSLLAVWLGATIRLGVHPERAQPASILSVACEGEVVRSEIEIVRSEIEIVRSEIEMARSEIEIARREGEVARNGQGVDPERANGHAPAARIRDEEGEGDEGRDDLSTPPSQRS